MWQNPVPLRSNRTALRSVYVKAAWFEQVEIQGAVVEYSYNQTVDHAEYSMLHVLRRLDDMKLNKETQTFELPLATKLELEQQVEDSYAPLPAPREATAAPMTAVGGMEQMRVEGKPSRSGRRTTRAARM